jgi:hypothetical protein
VIRSNTASRVAGGAARVCCMTGTVPATPDHVAT